jgi:tripartite-type tricarboxylate transporter receptor subunit TctC
MNNYKDLERRDFLRLMGVVGSASVLGGLAGVPLSYARENYPDGKITWIVGHPPGGGIDMVARGLAPHMAKYLQALSLRSTGTGVVIKNLPGGAEMRAMNELYHSKPDGYTVASGGDILHTRAILGELGFNLFDITFVARLSSGTKIVVTNSRSNLRTWDDIVKASKKAPLRIAITGFGASNHIATILLIDETGLAAKPVIFDGTAGANAALIRGDVALGLNSEDSLKSLIDAGELRPVLTFSEKSEYPGVNNVKEIGFPELVEPLKSQRYLIAPPKLPAAIKTTLQNVLKKAFADKEFLAWNEKAKMSYDPVIGPEIDLLVKKIQNFYQSKESILREYLTEKKA